MRDILFVPVGAVLITIIAGCSTLTTTNESKACLYRDSVQRWSAPDDSRLVITDRMNTDYDVMFFEDCPGLTSAQTLRVDRGTDTCVHGGDKIIFRKRGEDQDKICEIVDVYPSIPTTDFRE